MATRIIPPNYDSDDYDSDPELESANDLTGHQDDVVVVVMGVTGAGKSLFIKLVTGDTSVKIGDDLDSETSDIQVLPFRDPDSGRKVTLVNIPGFNDSRPKLSDTDILKRIADFLVREYDQNRKLSGFIYVHRISDPRFNGQSSRNLRMFRELCGPVAYKNVVVLTTYWDQVPTHEVGAKREAQLKSKFFAKLVEGGAQFMRHDDTVESTRKVLRHILPMPPTITQIQTEIRKEGKSLMETAAGSVHSKEVEEAITNYKKGIADLTAEMATIKESNKAPRQELETELAELRNSLAERELEQAELKKGLDEGGDLHKRLDTNADVLRARFKPQIQSLSKEAKELRKHQETTITEIQTENWKESKSHTETAAGSEDSKDVEETLAKYKKKIADLTAEMAILKESNKAARPEVRNSLAGREREQAELKKDLDEGRDLRKRLDMNADVLRPQFQPQIQSSTITTVMSPKHTKHMDIYVKAFSALRMGLPIYDPSMDVQLGDIGFMDENDGFFRKLYNVAEPPVDIDGCPPAVDLVKGALRYERLDAIYLKLNTTKGSPCRVNVPVTSMGNTVEIGYKFAQVHGHESILIPGNFIVKENLEELGLLKEYTNKYHQWIRREYATRHNLKLKQLILVVGTVKTNNWAIAVTSKKEIVEDLAFTISSLAGAKVWGEWSKNISVARSGPYMGNNQENTTANQTLFIRCIAALRSDTPLRKKEWVPTHAPPRTIMQRLRAALDTDDS